MIDLFVMVNINGKCETFVFMSLDKSLDTATMEEVETDQVEVPTYRNTDHPQKAFEIFNAMRK